MPGSIPCRVYKAHVAITHGKLNREPLQAFLAAHTLPGDMSARLEGTVRSRTGRIENKRSLGIANGAGCCRCVNMEVGQIP